MTKYIFLTGGVVSSLGKGITAASIGCLLKLHGLKVNMLKIDPYLNIDPGTMSPYQHGEVYVTADGGETDLDLGHYERFLEQNMKEENNMTAGQIYDTIIKKERKGDYLGKTVQVVPHVTDEIKFRIKKLARNNDIVIVEIGGTVGDIESLPFLEAARQFSYDLGKEKVLYIHVTLVPTIEVTGETKTKPTQHSVMQLRNIGIQPDIIICRCKHKLLKEMKSKIALFCNVKEQAVIDEPDVGDIIYEVPILLQQQNIDLLILNYFGFKYQKKNNLTKLNELIQNYKKSNTKVTISVAGKYTELKDAYKSIWEALIHSGIFNKTKINIKYVDVEKETLYDQLKFSNGILVPGGFGDRGIEGKIKTIEYARVNKIPFLGLCLGMQCAVIEFARNVCGLKGANSTEFCKNTPYPVISLMEEQKKVDKMGGTMRLGEYKCVLDKNSISYKLYGVRTVYERHRHRYEFNNKYRNILEKNGLKVVGINPTKNLVEIIEIKDHPWFIATQFHPEFYSRPLRPHPLFNGFINAAKIYSSKEKK